MTAQTAEPAMCAPIPVVDYLVLGDQPHLVAHGCVACGAVFFDRRNACGACSATEFEAISIPTVGELRTFTIVEQSSPGAPVPFVAGVVDCGGVSVRTNVVNVEPRPERIHTGMKMALVTYSLGKSRGYEVIGFGYEPVDRGGDIT